MTRSRQFSGLDPTVDSSPSGRFIFRRPVAADVDALVALSRQPHNMAAHGWNDATADQEEAFFRSEGFAQYSQVTLVATLRSDVMVAKASLSRRADRSGDHSIGIHVDADHRRTGVATELMAIMILAVQAHDLVGETWVGTAVSNVGMQRVMENLGYSPTHDQTPYSAPNGDTIPAIWYRVGRGAAPPTIK